MPRLLFLVTEDWYFFSHRLALAKAALEAGFQVTVLTRLTRHRRAIEEAGLRALHVEMDRRGMNPLGLLQEAWKVARIYRREQPDVVHHVALRPVVVGAVAARLAGVRSVVSAVAGMGFLFTDGGRAGWARRALERVLPWVLARGLVIVQNADDARMLRRLGVSPDRIVLIPGAGVDVSRFAPGSKRHDGMPIVMMASRLLWDKGVGDFVEAARAIGPRARFVLVGGIDRGNPRAVPAERVRAWVQEGVIEWWGERDDMPDVLNAAQVVCLPSYYREGMPKVLLEAMACGKACVTTDTVGCRDCVRNGDNGLLVRAKDPSALAEAIVQLLDDGSLRDRMGERGRARAETEFRQERICAQTLALYRELLP